MENKHGGSRVKDQNLIIQVAGEKDLSPTQKEFNRLMKSLEAARTKYSKEEANLDRVMVLASKELMPLVEKLKRVNRDMVLSGYKALETVKLNAKRRYWFGDLLAAKAIELIQDPAGLDETDLDQLEKIVTALKPEDDPERSEEKAAEEFASMRKEMEEMARATGLTLDLDGLDPTGDPDEFLRMMHERLADAIASPKGKQKSKKPSKAQLEKERKLREQEEAKNKDIKSLFKQLAKAFHPDLELDPVLRAHKEGWMQRLNAAYATDDLREMLQLEMEWLGEEATNLANASDEKLKVYCAVLKEQISQQRQKISGLIYESRYGLLQRFVHPFLGEIGSPNVIKLQYRAKIDDHQEMLTILQANNIHTKKMMTQWADTNFENSNRPY